MPRVPTYRRQESLDLMPNYRQSANVNADMFGGASGNESLARGLQQLGSGLDSAGRHVLDYAINEKRKEDDLIGKDAYTKFSDKVSVLMNNDILQRKGINVQGLAQSAEESMQKLYGEYSQGLSKNQKRIFDAFAGSLTRNSLNNVRGYQRRQLESASNARDDAILNNNIRDVTSMIQPDNPNNSRRVIEDGLLVVDATINDRAIRNGWTEEQRLQNLQNAHTRYHSSVVEKFLGNDDITNAKLYLEKNKNSIVPEIEMGLEKKIENHSDRLFVQEEVGVLYNKMLTVDEYGVGGVNELQKYIRDNYEGKVEEDMMNYAKILIHDVRQAKASQLEYDRNKIVDKIEGSKTKQEAVGYANEMKHPPARDFLLRVVESMYPSKTPKTDVVSVAKEMITAGKLRIKIDKKEIKDPKELLFMAINSGITNKATLDGLSEYFNKGGVGGTLTQAGVNRVTKVITGEDPSSKEYTEKYTGLYDAIVERLPYGKTVTDEMLHDIISKLMTTVTYDNGNWFFSSENTTVLGAQQKGKLSVSVPELSESDRFKYSKMLRNSGKKVTEERMIDLKKRDLMRNN